MISNTWNRPFQVTRVEIISGGKSIKPDFFGFIKKSGYSSARYRIDLEKFWKTRRVLTDAIMVEEIDFDYDTVQYDLGFIAPDDEVIFFRTFEWIPVESEKTRIRIGIKYYEMEKVIDFDVADFEYYESETDELETLPEVILKNENR